MIIRREEDEKKTRTRSSDIKHVYRNKNTNTQQRTRRQQRQQRQQEQQQTHQKHKRQNLNPSIH
eukprot:11189209-Lingulodinium_polyedra.AAC.1